MDKIFFEKEGKQGYAFRQYHDEDWCFVTKEPSGIWRAGLNPSADHRQTETGNTRQQACEKFYEQDVTRKSNREIAMAKEHSEISPLIDAVEKFLKSANKAPSSTEGKADA